MYKEKETKKMRIDKIAALPAILLAGLLFFPAFADGQDGGRRMPGGDSPAKSESAPLSPLPEAELAQDGGFESSFGVGPILNPFWAGTASSFTNPFCVQSLCGNGGGAAPPDSGIYWVWFGGTSTAYTASVQQNITIPAGARPRILYRLRVGSVSTPATASMRVLIDDNPIQVIPQPAAAETGYTDRYAWIPPGYADGQSHTIKFDFQKPATGGTVSFTLDNISIETNPLFDTSLEASTGIGPYTNPFWGATSIRFPSPLCTLPFCGGPGAPRTGNFYTWFGGTSLTETALLSQSLALPRNSRPVAKFWLRVGGVTAPHDAALNVLLDGNPVRVIPEPTLPEAAYTQRSVALPRTSADGGPHGFALQYINPAGSGVSNFYVDDITFESGAAPFDFDGDGRTDIGISRVNGPAREWWWRRSINGATFATAFGLAGDTIAPADFTGDGKVDIAQFRASTGQWFILRSEDQNFTAFNFGANGDIPAPADFDGDGKADAAVYRPSAQTWFILRSTDLGTTFASFGAAADRPAVADYDGDGKADIAVWKPNVGQWWWLNSSGNALSAFQFGAVGDKPVQGDYTGDGKADVAIFRPASNTWFVLRSEDQNFFAFPFGAAGDIPAPGDYDGDGKFDSAVFRPSAATWFLNQSTSGVGIVAFGAAADRPLPNAYIP